MEIKHLRTLLGKTGTARSATNPAGIYTGTIIQININGFIWIGPKNGNYQVACKADSFREHEIEPKEKLKNEN